MRTRHILRSGRARRRLPKRTTLEWPDSPYEKWAHKFVREHHWGFAYEVGDYDDAIAECALAFSLCLDRYSWTIYEPRHFMSLYMRTVRNRFHRLHERAQRMRNVVTFDSEVVDRATYSDGPIAAALASLSDEARTILRLLAEQPEEVLDRVLGRRPGETLAAALARSPLRRYYRLPPGRQVDAELLTLLRRT